MKSLAKLLVIVALPTWLWSEIIVANHNANGIVVFDDTANGDVAPLRTIQGANTGLNHPFEIIVSGGEIYTSNYLSPYHISVFPEGANGDVVPSRVINTPVTSMRGLAIDNGEIFGATSTSINVYNTTDVNAAAKRTISGASTGLSDVYGICVYNGEIFVANHSGGNVTVYNTTDNGDIAPKREITGLSSPANVRVYNNELAVLHANGDVSFFSINASGAAAPIRTFNPDNINDFAGGLFIQNGNVYIGGSYDHNVSSFSAGSTGAVSPLISISGANTTLDLPVGIYITSPATTVSTPLFGPFGALFLSALMGFFGYRRLKA